MKDSWRGISSLVCRRHCQSLCRRTIHQASGGVCLHVGFDPEPNIWAGSCARVNLNWRDYARFSCDGGHGGGGGASLHWKSSLAGATLAVLPLPGIRPRTRACMEMLVKYIIPA